MVIGTKETDIVDDVLADSGGDRKMSTDGGNGAIVEGGLYNIVEKRVKEDPHFKRLKAATTDIEKAKILEEVGMIEVARVEAIEVELLKTDGVDAKDAANMAIAKLRATKSLLDMILTRHNVELADLETMKNEIVGKVIKWVVEKVNEAFDETKLSSDDRKKVVASLEKGLKRVNVELKI